uniref:Kelch-like protein 20 n=1 Tax=Phallusia mammillata TaxID=59560 RepID=A0A6F9DFH2_9ASCI|nr:kelch-like protein 20 [Phallusia mammillata]
MRPTPEERSLHKEKIMDYLNFDRKGPNRHCNKTLTSDGKNFSVHDCILGAASDYFKTMFSVEMKEKYDEVVSVENVPLERLENVLEFIYSGDIEVTEENMLEVLEDSEYTQIEGLKSFCNRFILQVVSADNCLKLRAYAKRYNLDDVVDRTDQSIKDNFASVMKHKDFMQLDVGDMTNIIKQRNKDQEEAVFTGIVQWVNYNPLQREELFVNLFSQIDISSMSSGFLAEVSTEVEP